MQQCARRAQTCTDNKFNIIFSWNGLETEADDVRCGVITRACWASDGSDACIRERLINASMAETARRRETACTRTRGRATTLHAGP